MPLYEYQCFVCHHRFERLQRVADPEVEACPECGGSVRRLLGVPALQFKGSGWYVTDYGKRNGGSGKATAQEDKPKSEAATPEKPASDPKTTKPSAAKTD